MVEGNEMIGGYGYFSLVIHKVFFLGKDKKITPQFDYEVIEYRKNLLRQRLARRCIMLAITITAAFISPGIQEIVYLLGSKGKLMLA